MLDVVIVVLVATQVMFASAVYNASVALHAADICHQIALTTTVDLSVRYVYIVYVVLT